MKFLHLSDLHIGKRLNEFPLIEDQVFILDQILDIAEVQKVDAVIIAGDIYDKSIPSTEGIRLFDDFLYKFSCMRLPVFIISGNHDSAERLSFASRILTEQNIYFSPVYEGSVDPTELSDAYGRINIYMLPFVKPVQVRKYFPDAEINSYNDAVKAVIDSLSPDTSDRNIIIAHQFVTGAERCESEELSVGGLDNIDSSVFDIFDYCALGHIHGPQYLGSDKIRYCGTPLKYSFSETRHRKSVTIVELLEKGTLNISTVPLRPLRDMREIKGDYNSITLRDNYINTNTGDYIRVILTDENDIPDAISKLRTIYPNIMRLDYDNKRTRGSNNIGIVENIETKSPLDLFREFYFIQNNSDMTEEQIAFSQHLIEDIWGEDL